jgi:adenine C2-methylase RlmN of 23S rRNA A2503 and tRNA A37
MLFLSYLFLQDVNDSGLHMRAIADLIRQRPAYIRHLYHVNLLRFNPNPELLGNKGLPLVRASENHFQRFARGLNGLGVGCTYFNKLFVMTAQYVLLS